MMDTEVLEKMRAKKEVIGQYDKARHLRCVREQFYVDDWHKFCGAFDLHLFSFGVKPYGFIITLKTDKTKTYQALITVEITHNPRTSLKKKRK
jgi:hypothetical protein